MFIEQSLDVQWDAKVEGKGSVTKNCFYLKFVHARQENPPEFSVFGGLKSYIPTLDLEGSLLHWVAVLIHNKSMDTSMNLSQEFDQGLRKNEILSTPRNFYAWEYLWRAIHESNTYCAMLAGLFFLHSHSFVIR